MAGRADYIINTIGKKHYVCVKRTGREAGYAAIATADSDTTATKIIEALNLHQGKKVALETIVQRTLDDVRQQLTKERALTGTLREEKRHEQRAKEELDRQLRNVSRDLASMTDRAIKAEGHATDLEAKIMRERAEAQ